MSNSFETRFLFWGQRKIPVDLHFIVRLRSMGQGKTGASQFSLRDSVQEETVFAV